MAAHTRQPLQSSPGRTVQQWGCPEPWGSCTPPGQHCCLHIAPLLHCHLSPGRSAQPLLGCHLPAISTCPPSAATPLLSPLTTCRQCHTIAWTHPGHSISSWPLLGQRACPCLSPLPGTTVTAAGWGELRKAGQGQSQAWCPQDPQRSHCWDDAVQSHAQPTLPANEGWNCSKYHFHWIYPLHKSHYTCTYHQLPPLLCWWQSKSLQTASTTLLQRSSGKPPMGVSTQPSKTHGHLSSPQCCVGESREMPGPMEIRKAIVQLSNMERNHG